MNKEECDKLEELRLSLWASTHEIEKNAGKLVGDIDKLTEAAIEKNINSCDLLS